MDYKKMLEKGRKELPESVFEKERFEIPKVKGHIQGNRTVISNIHQIATLLGRPVEHFVKYLLKELATSGDLKKNALMMGTKVAASKVNEKIRKYAEEFVLCKECGKPDTKMIKESGLQSIRCMACGSRHAVKSKI